MTTAHQTCCRFLDPVFAAAGLFILTPLLLAIAILILFDDGLPILFKQIRVGKQGKPFRIWKFRTMRAGAQGTAVTAAGDNRVTRVGAFLRRHKLDELPQLVNVLKGDMSMVGPRPEVPEFVHLEAPIWQAVLQVRPGVTDVAALLFYDEEKLLRGPGDPATVYRETVLPVKLVLNLAYLRSRSYWRDLKLIYLAVRYSLFPRRFDPNLIRRAAGTGVSE
jgi:lipopolysaccharide/colanic/teichoic acid biosynthesis glycosyltransferase